MVLSINEANLSPSDCHLFPATKQNLGCHKFEENSEITVFDTMADNAGHMGI